MKLCKKLKYLFKNILFIIIVFPRSRKIITLSLPRKRKAINPNNKAKRRPVKIKGHLIKIIIRAI